MSKRTREGYKNLVPEEWKHRIELGLCAVCGKPYEEWDPNRKGKSVTCSEKCGAEYNSKFVYWSDLSYKILKRDNFTCVKCGKNQNKLNEEIERKKRKLEREREKWFLENVPASEMEKVRKRFQEQAEEYLNKANFYFIASFDQEVVRKVATHEFFNDALPYADVVNRNVEWKKECPFPDPGDIEKEKIELNVDHIRAITNGGDEWDESNLQTLCEDCHRQKTREDMTIKRNGSNLLLPQGYKVIE
jgi:5-methylcytosine-specific restriction endonuclease McrA